MFDSETKKTLLFLKVFSLESKNFFAEILGIHFLNGISSPIMQAIGKFNDEAEKVHFVTAETPAPGMSFQHRYNEVAKYPVHSKERADAFAVLRNAVAACGKGLAKLHAIKDEAQPFPEAIKKFMALDLDKAINKLPLDFPVGPLQEFAAKLFEKMESLQFFPAVTHGDVKLVHAFYGDKTEKFGLIDPTYVADSINPSGEPQGIALKDYFHFLNSLSLNRVCYGLDEAQQNCAHRNAQ